MLIQEHLVALGVQPLVQLTGVLPVLAGMADEDPGHRFSSGVAAAYRSAGGAVSDVALGAWTDHTDGGLTADVRRWRHRVLPP